MNTWQIKIVSKPQRFINYKLLAVPLYNLKVGDEIMVFSKNISGIYRIHSMRKIYSVGYTHIIAGAKGLGEINLRIYDKMLGYKAIRIPNETNTKRSKGSPKDYEVMRQLGDRGAKWNLPSNSVCAIRKNS